jgi:hypothetical protein
VAVDTMADGPGCAGSMEIGRCQTGGRDRAERAVAIDKNVGDEERFGVISAPTVSARQGEGGVCRVVRSR